MDNLIAKTSIKLTRNIVKKSYNVIFKKDRTISILILCFMFILLLFSFSSGKSTIFDYCFVGILTVMFIILFRIKDNKIKKIIENSEINEKTCTINFYNDYFTIDCLLNNQTISKKYQYQDIKKVYDDKEYIYILVEDVFEIIDKKDATEELLKKFDKEIITDKNLYKNKEKVNFSLLITLLSTIICIILIMLCICLFNIPGFPLGAYEYLWIFFIFIPFPIYTIILGIKFKNIRNFILGLLFFILFIYCGINTFIKKYYINHSFNNLNKVEKIVNMDFPSDGKISVAISYKDNIKKMIAVKFNNSDKEEVLEIVTNGYWRDFQTFPENYIDNYYLTLANNCDYFCSYNVSSKRFNSYGKGDNIIYMAYNEDTNTLYILDYII